MPIIVGPGGITGDIFARLAGVEQLASELERLGQGDLPTAETLAQAPFLEVWETVPRQATCLVGICRDHPSRKGPVITTSDVWVLAPELRWARTLSRYYRLGRRLEPNTLP